MVNFQVNDVCNARCVMCHVWQHKRDHEMSVSELTTRLSDPFFSDVEHVGITGGEPTLVKNLDEYYLALPEICSRLTGASFITHGLDTDRAIAVYTRVARVYRSRQLEFHGMVSLDGLGEVHDRVRGRAGAFDRAARTLFGLKMADIPASACCTIVKSNVWHVWPLLEWGYGKTYIRFRVAEFINRLSNHGATDEIRAFDVSERLELISFFEHLIQSYEPDESVRRTYASIVSQLAGGPRLTGCPYQEGRAINLDCRGQFAVCAPRGTPHPLGTDAERSVAAARDERATIVATHCARCIHDYHDDWTPAVATLRAQAARVASRLEAGPSVESALVKREPGPSRARGPRPHPRVLVLGWYGTETLGDLAILASIVSEYRQAAPGALFVLPSHFPSYTRVNVERLGLDCLVTDYGSPELVGDLWQCDTVIVGGGPLMDVPQIQWLASVFERARPLGCRTIIESCGVGPVNLPRTGDAILRIANAADEIRLRDRGSARTLARLGFGGPVSVVPDPAARWAQSTGVRHRGTSTGPICVFARELTSEYPQPTTAAEATAKLVTFLRSLGDRWPDRAIELHAMHHFPIGHDDREYARRLARAIDRPGCTVDSRPRTPLETLEIMSGASFVVAMRFHSVVFAHAIGAPFIAIDYTNGGKVADFMVEHGLGDQMVPLMSLDQIDLSTLELPGLRLESVAQ
jgi:polysaccharide pyruvyl transferase WcaK-like protein/sulfatase maturation enzyme AslB (radical SAM superfamily)